MEKRRGRSEIKMMAHWERMESASCLLGTPQTVLKQGFVINGHRRNGFLARQVQLLDNISNRALLESGCSAR